jgi:hypothetical protein
MSTTQAPKRASKLKAKKPEDREPTKPKMLIFGQPGVGKSQPLSANILTPSGWVKMGDIKAGDMVISVDGNPTKVLEVYPQGELDVVELVFHDGSKTRCSKDHLWQTRTKLDRAAKRLGSIKETSDLIKSIESCHSIPVVSEVYFPENEVLIHPYIMGCLLGDGCLRGDDITITQADEDLFNNVEKLLPDGFKLSKRSHLTRCETRSITTRRGDKNPFTEYLRSVGLMGKKSLDKFVPTEYLINSVENRIALLQGLLDTDGTVGSRGTTVSFSSASVNLANAVAFIVQSLGGVAFRSVRSKRGYKKDGIYHECLPSFTVTANLPNHIAPFAIARKSGKVVEKTKYQPSRFLKEINESGKELCQCISVDHPTSLYVTDDFIVTHNTWFSLDFPGCYYIDSEGGSARTHYMDKLKASGGEIMGPEEGANDFETVLGQVQALATEKHEFKTLIIDSISKLFNSAVTTEQERLGDKDAFGASKKPAVAYMRRLVNWIQRLDMNVILVAHQKDEWGVDAKGERCAIGHTFDCWDKLEYELDLVLQLMKQGSSRVASVRKSRLLGFPDKDRFPISFDTFAERYGKDVIDKEVKAVILATAEEVSEIVRLVTLLKLGEDEINKWWTKWNVSDWTEMSDEQAAKAIKFLQEKINPTVKDK